MVPQGPIVVMAALLLSEWPHVASEKLNTERAQPLSTRLSELPLDDL